MRNYYAQNAKLRAEYLNTNLNIFLRKNSVTQLYVLPQPLKAFTAYIIDRSRNALRIVYNSIVYDIDMNDIEMVCTIDSQEEPARPVWINPNRHQQVTKW